MTETAAVRARIDEAMKTACRGETATLGHKSYFFGSLNTDY
jgi:hypothetical protein